MNFRKLAENLTNILRLKYTEAKPLSRDHAYFKTQDAQAFWSLIPYYVPQFGPYACSVASITMLVNAARYKSPLTTKDDLAVQEDVLDKANIQEWKDHVGGKGDDHGISLDLMRIVMPAALSVYGLKKFTVDVIHMDGASNAPAILRKVLEDYEKTDNSFLIANYSQCELTGDPEACGGHYSPVGAYDSVNRRVLILDVDRRWVEPYWVDEGKLVQAMSTVDTGAKQFRGFVWVKLQ
jgi:hypothetical protein